MRRVVRIYKKGGSTCVDEIINGKEHSFSTNENRELKVINGGVLIMPDDSKILNNFTILISELEGSFEATTGKELRNEILVKGYFKKGGGGVLGGSFSKTVVSTLNIGGIKIGDEFKAGNAIEEAIIKLVSPYVSPKFTSLTIVANNNVVNAIVGEEVVLQKAILNYINDSDGNAPANITIVGEGFNVSINETNKEYILDISYSLTKYTGITENWYLKGFDKDNNEISKYYNSISWKNQFLFGASSLELDASNFQEVLNSLSKIFAYNGIDVRRNCASENEATENYTYAAYNSAYSDLSSIVLDGAAPILGAFTKVGEFNWVNSFGLLISTTVYRSISKGAFSSTNFLNFS
jgi:hypothetical protein